MLWKAESYRFNGIDITLKTNAIWPFILKNSFQAFRGKKAAADLLFVFSRVPAPQVAQPKRPGADHPRFSIASLSGVDSALLSAPQVGKRLAAVLKNPGTLALELKQESVMMFDFAHNRADLFYSPASQNNPGEIGFGPAMLAPFMPNFDALLLHASAIVRHGRAAVFLALDEGGKTTAVRLSPQGTILCDDQVLVRRVRGGFRVSGTPWGFHVNPRIQAPLAGLFLLDKADCFALEPLPVRELVAHVWEEIKNPLSMLPKPLKKKAFAVICAITAAVPAWKLSFPRDHIDWEILDRALEQKTSAPAKRNKQGQKKPGPGFAPLA